jgi:UDP-glucose 4-epimerase
MTLLIIGSEGFIGKSCYRHFQELGHSVFGVDILAAAASRVENYKQLDNTFLAYDSVFVNGQYDVCINASGSANVGFSFTDPEKDHDLNVRNVEAMLIAIQNSNPACKFINFSSAAVYGNPVELPIKESDPVNPLSPYGLNKLESERLLKRFSDEQKLRTCSLRIFSAYGPGLKKQLFWDLYQKALVSDKVELFGTGKESRDFIFIDDLCKAIECVIGNASFRGECINIASGEESTIETVGRLFLLAFAPEKEICFNKKTKEGDPANWCADISILKGMGFSCKVSMEEGIGKYTTWLRQGSGLV